MACPARLAFAAHGAEISIVTIALRKIGSVGPFSVYIGPDGVDVQRQGGPYFDAVDARTLAALLQQAAFELDRLLMIEENKERMQARLSGRSRLAGTLSAVRRHVAQL